MSSQSILVRTRAKSKRAIWWPECDTDDRSLGFQISYLLVINSYFIATDFLLSNGDFQFLIASFSKIVLMLNRILKTCA